MKYTAEKGSGAMTRIPNVIKIGLGIQNLIGRVRLHRHTDMEIA
jgi:hypothetical protein